MKFVSAFVLMISFVSSLHASVPDDRFDSYHLVGLASKITKGVVRVRKADADKAAYLIRAQIMYLVGHLNGYGGGADISRASIKVRESRDFDDEFQDVTYDAEFTTGWPTGSQLPGYMSSVLPLRADSEGKRAFHDAYQATCASHEEPFDANSLFYYYRPQMQGCNLLSGYFDSKNAVRTRVDFTKSPLQTLNKFPEYDKVWEDGRMVTTMIFSSYKAGGGAQDQGVQSYNQAYQSIRQMLGNPSSMNFNLGPNDSPGTSYPDIEMTYKYAGGRYVNINLLLIQDGSLHKPSEKFLTRYHARTLISDVLSYNGHSGLGSNIRALSKLGQFAKDRWYLFFVNGCDTFTYTDTALESTIAALNPGSAPTKHLDLITNAMPSPFNGFAQNAVAIIRAMIDKQQNYRQMLGGFVSWQRPLVTGEEDNAFPKPF